MNVFIKRIRDVEIAMGNNRRIIDTSEYENIEKIRRSPFLIGEPKIGEKLKT